VRSGQNIMYVEDKMDTSLLPVEPSIKLEKKNIYLSRKYVEATSYYKRWLYMKCLVCYLL